MLESGRILRSRGYLASAYILPEALCADGVDLVVMTRDVWSTEPDTSLSRNGGENKSGFGVSESNLLGYGNELAIGYEKVGERSAINYDLTSPHIFNSRYYAHLGYADKTDGKDKIVELAKPFYSPANAQCLRLNQQSHYRGGNFALRRLKRSAFLYSQERYEILLAAP